MRIRQLDPLRSQPSRSFEERRTIQRLLDTVRMPGDHRDEIAELVNRLWYYETEQRRSISGRLTK